MFTVSQIPCLTAPPASMETNNKSENKRKYFSFTDVAGDTLHEHGRYGENEVGEKQ